MPLDTATVAIITGALMGGVEEVELKAIVKEAVLAEPSIIEELKKVHDQLSGPLPEGFLDQASTWASEATPYDGPGSVALSAQEILSHL